MAASLFGSFKGFDGFDGFARTLDEVKVKTRSGALLTLLSALFIITFTVVEFNDYRRLHIDSAIVVDRSKGEKLTATFNVTFPRVPCFLLSVDVTDISGEIQRDVSNLVMKTRLDEKTMKPILDAKVGFHPKSELEKLVSLHHPGWCGSCFGGVPPDSGCCQTCDEVRKSYMDRGWAFNDPDSIDQCVQEHWKDKLQEQAHEGCNIVGTIKVNKVAGNIQFSPGRSFVLNRANIYEIVPYLKDVNHFFGHFIHQFAFESEMENRYTRHVLDPNIKRILGIDRGPLDEIYSHTESAEYMFQYFLKVVSTKYKSLNGHVYSTHQFSATSYERDLATGVFGKNEDGVQLTHDREGLPGAFFNIEISPMQVLHFESRQSFAHFVTSTAVIVGGVLTVASLLDALLFRTGRLIKQGQDAVAAETAASGGKRSYGQAPVVKLL